MLQDLPSGSRCRKQLLDLPTHFVPVCADLGRKRSLRMFGDFPFNLY